MKLNYKILSLLLLFLPLHAEEPLQSDIPAGSRALPIEEAAAIEKRCTIARLQGLAEELQNQPLQLRSLEPRKYISGSQHPGVLHNLTFKAPYYNQITLQDGSVWEVRKSDRNIIKQWYPRDSLVLLPNESLFADPFNLKLYNENLHVSVDVRLLMGPLLNGINTYWIEEIDKSRRELRLNDGTVWKISVWDREKFDYWISCDTLIIGCNDSFLGVIPNILINSNTNTYVYATQIE